MNASRHLSIAAMLAAAWLVVGCQGSPIRPTQPLPPPPAATLVSVTGVVSEIMPDQDATSMPLAGATITIVADPANPLSTVTDDNGFYSVTQSKGTVTVTVAKDGYETVTRSIELTEDAVLNFELKRSE
jgi:Carboxypeptidase regulatory-like domain